ncbi:MAG: hypothetical protein BECKG1743D_GA0114223_111652 [Candidatus Kentron sp. G]|nr:MAG: hypothetical protein BECKG1743F_GA0114225_111792 [Candidatus Kentron sp. G]VFN07727.1 MAG: hypothetical protein BECKG1743E_GA0114224_112821 [Candidatus Kentron sp. G]VFN07855.1 MAG: hypothetical protein BECKG1743D_GA0114223_111652 [Candidatus Kentron sp. G]
MSLPKQNTTSNHSMTAVFSADRLLEEAMQQTGLTDFGGDAFHEPFEVLLKSLREEANLNE